MKVACPNCGKTVVVCGLGRPRRNDAVVNIIDGLKRYRSVTSLAQEMRCSRGHIYDVLKANGLKLKDVVDGKDVAKAKGEQNGKD